LRSNRLRELFNEGRPAIAAGVHIPWPAVTELVGHTGLYDYIEFRGEYTSWDLHDLDNIARAMDVVGTSSMFKVERQNNGFIAQRALGAGFQNLLFADLKTADEVREAISFVKPDTPQHGGLNGCHARRSVRYFLDEGSPEFVQAMDDVVIGIMIEKREAVNNIEEILAVDGIDMLQFGPGDYAMSIGKPKQWADPEVKEAETRTINMALEKGLRVRMEFAALPPAETLKEYLDRGIKDFCVDADVVAIYNWFKDKGEELREIVTP
jgi:2-keto-3-deoxy-L-rhamnonate aldolase RhmA